MNNESVKIRPDVPKPIISENPTYEESLDFINTVQLLIDNLDEDEYECVSAIATIFSESEEKHSLQDLILFVRFEDWRCNFLQEIELTDCTQELQISKIDRMTNEQFNRLNCKLENLLD